MKSLTAPLKMSRARLCGVLAQTALIFFSSTPMAGEASQYAYVYYFHRIHLLQTLASGIDLHVLAQKGVHFVLFFSLGTWLYYSLRADRRQRLFWTVGFCFLVGVGSEVYQFFVGRHAAASDVLLNTAKVLKESAARWAREYVARPSCKNPALT